LAHSPQAKDSQNISLEQCVLIRCSTHRIRHVLLARVSTHPLGQTLIVAAGCGWVQREGGPVEEIRPGDVVWFSPGEKHWHGATATTAMTHIAMQERLNGKVVDWMEQVSDEQYRR
jgi:mannose-6-phosphate isomerase-like protein (cupin superfamily)